MSYALYKVTGVHIYVRDEDTGRVHACDSVGTDEEALARAIAEAERLDIE